MLALLLPLAGPDEARHRATRLRQFAEDAPTCRAFGPPAGGDDEG
jgi:hypothetical protein